MAGAACARPAGGAGGLRWTIAARRRADGPPRAARAPRSPSAARLAVGADRRAGCVPARDRHADRGRAVRGDRRLRPLRAPRAADELPRRRALRALHRRAPPARLDHQVRQPARPPAAGRGRLALPPRAARRPSSCAAARRRRARQSSRSPGRPNAACTASGSRMEQRGKRRTIIAVAVARELAGFCWAVTTSRLSRTEHTLGRGRRRARALRARASVTHL